MFRFDGTDFTDIAPAGCRHDFTYGLAVYGNKALTTGTGHNLQLETACAVKTETYDFQADTWSDEVDYPFAT